MEEVKLKHHSNEFETQTYKALKPQLIEAKQAEEAELEEFKRQMTAALKERNEWIMQRKRPILLDQRARCHTNIGQMSQDVRPVTATESIENY